MSLSGTAYLYRDSTVAKAGNQLLALQVEHGRIVKAAHPLPLGQAKDSSDWGVFEPMEHEQRIVFLHQYKEAGGWHSAYQVGHLHGTKPVSDLQTLKRYQTNEPPWSNFLLAPNGHYVILGDLAHEHVSLVIDLRTRKSFSVPGGFFLLRWVEEKRLLVGVRLWRSFPGQFVDFHLIHLPTLSQPHATVHAIKPAVVDTLVEPVWRQIAEVAGRFNLDSFTNSVLISPNGRDALVQNLVAKYDPGPEFQTDYDKFVWVYTHQGHSPIVHKFRDYEFDRNIQCVQFTRSQPLLIGQQWDVGTPGAYRKEDVQTHLVLVEPRSWKARRVLALPKGYKLFSFVENSH